MIDPETRKSLESDLAVQLAILPRSLLREMAAKHGGDAARSAAAARLVASLAFPYNIARSGERTAAPTIPPPSDGRKSWADEQ